MPTPAAHSSPLKIYLALNAAALIAAAAWMLSIAANAHFSSLRLLLIGATFLLAVLVAAAAVIVHIQPKKEKALRATMIGTPLASRLSVILGALFLIFWCLTWYPPLYTGSLRYYFVGLYPLIPWVTLATGSALILIWVVRHGSARTIWSQYWLEYRVLLSAAIIGLATIAVIVTLTWALKILHSNEPYWRGAGVPILAWQVFIAVGIGVLSLQVRRGSFQRPSSSAAIAKHPAGKIPRPAGAAVRPPIVSRRIPVDLFLFFTVWVISAFFWAAQPVPESFWVTGPRPPNHEYYPFSDLMTFDVGSQFALIGQGINNGVFWDRALYMSFLVYLHSLGGQNYQTLMSIQAVIFAVFPALTYLIGRKLHSRTAGLMLAALIMLRGVNSLIAAPWIHSSTFKHMLTDFPTAIGIAVFVLLMLKWLESPSTNRHLLLWAGGVLGLMSLLRPHVLLLLPAAVLLALWLYRSDRKQAVLTLGFIVLAFLASISPWTFLASPTGSIFALYGQRIHDVMQQRYPQLVPGSAADSQQPEAPEVPISPGASSVPISPSAAAVPTQNPSAPVTQNVPYPVSPTPSAPGVLTKLKAPTTSLPFPVTQFTHNLVTSALIFPDSPAFFSVLSTVKDGEDFWKFNWEGQMSLTAAIMLVLNLAIVCLGLGAACQRFRWRGLLPLAVFLVYHVANALARTSGGRYLVPVDWILVVYYVLGLVELLGLGALMLAGLRQQALPPLGHAAIPVDARAGLSRAFSTVVLLAVIGGLVPLAGVLYPRRYSAISSPSPTDQIAPYLSSLRLRRADVDAFLQQPGAVALNGRALYPRYYRPGKGELYSFGPFLAAPYPRMVFSVIGPQGLAYVVLPGKAPKAFPNASDISLLGCQSSAQGYSLVSAVAVILPAQHAGYARTPASPLTCPLPEPVCDTNGNCY